MMSHLSIEGGGVISRVVLGTSRSRALSTRREMLEASLAAGGSCLDTAHDYGGGASERCIGEWLRTGVRRADVTVISKGGHPPACRPDALESHLLESLA